MMQFTIRIRPSMLGLDVCCVRSSHLSATCSEFTDTSYAVRGGHGLSRGAGRGDRRVWNQKLAGGTTVRSIRGLRGVCRAQLLAAVRTVFRAPKRLDLPYKILDGKGLILEGDQRGRVAN